MSRAVTHSHADMAPLTLGQTQMLEKMYLDPAQPGSFTSAKALRTSLLLKKTRSKRGVSVKVPSLAQIQQWLTEKRSYTLHRPARKNYPMKKVVVGGVNIQLQADLVDLQQWASQNDGFRYILLVIDCFSRYGYAKPLKTKQGQPVADALEQIINEAEARIDRKIKKLQTDEGREFYNASVREFLSAKYIKLFSTKSPTKAQMVERLIRTLRAKQERFNTFRGKRRWVESFPKILHSYNKTVHSALPKNMTPADVNLENESLVWNHLYADDLLSTPKSLQRKLRALNQGKSLPLSTRKLNIGTPVRLSKRKRTFEKAFYQNYTDEIFFIAHISNNTTPITYRVSDINGELLEGVFYKQELTPVTFNAKAKGQLYAVENVLQEEIRPDGKKYLLVKWRGYPDSENSWIRSDQFASIKQAT